MSRTPSTRSVCVGMEATRKGGRPIKISKNVPVRGNTTRKGLKEKKEFDEKKETWL